MYRIKGVSEMGVVTVDSCKHLKKSKINLIIKYTFMNELNQFIDTCLRRIIESYR